jgi:hypothetical protein
MRKKIYSEKRSSLSRNKLNHRSLIFVTVDNKFFVFSFITDGDTEKALKFLMPVSQYKVKQSHITPLCQQLKKC